MKKHIIILCILFFQTIIYSQSKTDYSEIITEVVKLYEKDNVNIYYQLDNDIYELELFLIKNDKNNPKSEILKHININYKDFKKIYRKTQNKAISNYFSTQTTSNLKDNNMAFMGIPIISKDGNSAIIFGRYSCGFFCGQLTLFYFTKKDTKWLLSNLKEIK